MTDNRDLAKLLFCIAFDNASEETKTAIEELLADQTVIDSNRQQASEVQHGQAD